VATTFSSTSSLTLTVLSCGCSVITGSAAFITLTTVTVAKSLVTGVPFEVAVTVREAAVSSAATERTIVPPVEIT